MKHASTPPSRRLDTAVPEAPANPEPRSPPRSGRVTARYLRTKRVADTLCAVVLLLLLLPLFLLIALAIRLDSPGPVLFLQERAGARWTRRNRHLTWTERTFKILKFRTMKYRADQTLHRKHIDAYVSGELAAADVDAAYKLTDDPRVTRVGRFLRRSSLDELPQLINIIRGDMSLVGPRPVPCYEFAAYQEWQKERLHAVPGLTGLWQVRGRGRATFEESLRLDIEYVRKQSLVLDLYLLMLTLPAVVTGRGAR